MYTGATCYEVQRRERNAQNTSGRADEGGPKHALGTRAPTTKTRHNAKAPRKASTSLNLQVDNFEEAAVVENFDTVNVELVEGDLFERGEHAVVVLGLATNQILR